MTMQDYLALLDSVEKYQKNLCTVEQDIKAARLRITEASEQRKVLTEQRNASLETVKAEIIAEEEQRQKAPLTAERDDVEKELKDFLNKVARQQEELQSKDYAKVHEASYKVLNHSISIVNKIEPQFGSVITDFSRARAKAMVAEMELTDEMLTTLTEDVSNMSELHDVNRCIPILQTIIGKMFLPRQNAKKVSKSSLRLIALAVKTAAVVGAFALTPVVVVIPYTYGIFRSIADQQYNITNLTEKLNPFILLRELVAARKEQLDDICRQEREAGLEELRISVEAKREALEGRLHDIDQRIGQVRTQAIAAITEDEITARVNQKHSSKVKEASIKLDKAKEHMRMLLEKKDSIEVEMRRLRVALAEARKALESELVDLNKVGSDQRLLTSFFLGFDDAGRIISLDYAGDTSLIMYSGSDSSVVVPFVKMMIIQYFTNMLVNSIRIDIVDFENGGTEYDIFRGKNLSDVISIIATDTSEQTLIEVLHADMRVRSGRISLYAENIDEYNKIMLGRKSIPMEYRIVIFQAFSESLIANQKFLQLCRQGARVGIIMFLFVNISSLPKIDTNDKSGKGREPAKRWRDLIYAIPRQFFNFNAESGDVSDMGIRYKTDSLVELDKYLRGD